MDTILRFLPGLACIGGMALCLAMMGGMHRRSSGTGDAAESTQSSDVEGLRDEVAQLRSELEQRKADSVS